MEEGRNDFISYEYKEVLIDSAKASIWMDALESFGWELDERQAASEVPAMNHQAIIHLKRNRKIMNKAELTRLQRNFEACMHDMEQMEKAKTSKATICALTVGFIGTGFVAGATFAVTAQTPMILLCTILAIPGFILWAAAYFVYRDIYRKQSLKMDQLIEQKYDEVYELCEKGSKLLN